MKITNIKQAEEALFKLANIEAEAKIAEAEQNKIVAQANFDYAKIAVPLGDKKAEILNALKEYTETHRDELFEKNKKSAKLATGELGFRAGRDTVEVSDNTVSLLLGDKSLKDKIDILTKTSVEVNKSALAAMKPADLEKYEAKIVPGKDTFYAKPDEVKLPKSAA